MNFSEEIKIALETYDKQKGFFRRFFWEPSGIRAVRKLSAKPNLTDLFKAYSSFQSYFGLLKPSKARYKVYEVIAKQANLPKEISYSAFSLLENIYFSGFLTKENIDIILNLHPSKLGDPDSSRSIEGNFINPGISSVIKKLRGKLLTEAIFHVVLANTNPSALLELLENIYFILTPESPSFLFTEECHRIAWSRLPKHLLTEAIVSQIIRSAQDENPGQQVRQYVDQLLGINRNNPIMINDPQNTHHLSVHQSISESAIKLNNRYAHEIAENRLKEKLDEIRDYVDKLPNDSIENKAAKRCIERISKLNYIDRTSKLSIPQLLALTFVALNNDNDRQGGLDDAQKQFVQGLYEIQRGYNLSENGRDKSICASGTFNKLLEKLDGLHADVKVIHITPAVASLKLPIVVREVTIDYLSSMANTQTIEGLYKFTRLIEQINEDECVDVIWNQIKTEIIIRLFEEFGSLYKNKRDPKFTELVDSGQYLKLEDLSRFQKQILASPGYHQYCSQNLKNSFRFFPVLEKEKYRDEYPHNNAEAQQTDDRQFGLA